MWQGNVIFGDSWVGYLGEAHDNTPHAHIATQLAVGLDGDVSVRSCGRLVSGSGVMISPRTEHVACAESGQRVVFLYIAPHVALGHALEQRLGGQGLAVIDDSLVACIRNHVDIAAMVGAMRELIAVSDGRAVFDERLMRALDTLHDDPGHLGAMDRATAASGLSEARLRSLAREHLGIPLSQWMIWRKLERSTRAIAAGAGMANAAAEGGFSDQAHLARTMRRMFGITASDAAPPLRCAIDSFKTLHKPVPMIDRIGR